jgi:hypothetical protein
MAMTSEPLGAAWPPLARKRGMPAPAAARPSDVRSKNFRRDSFDRVGLLMVNSFPLVKQVK